MEEEKESFIFYRSFYESIKELESSKVKRIVEAICEKALNNVDVEFKEEEVIEKVIFKLIRPQLEANFKKYEDGKKGGNPNFKKGQSNPYYLKKNEINEDNLRDNLDTKNVEKSIIRDNSGITRR